jgi:hypothetical protein
MMLPKCASTIQQRSDAPCPVSRARPHSTVTDITIKMGGLIVAAISVVSSGMQQLLCGVVQRKHKLQSHQLLANTAPVQGAMLIVVGPYIDYLITGSNVMDYSWTNAAALVMFVSCSVAVLVNISQVWRPAAVERAGVARPAVGRARPHAAAQRAGKQLQL